MKLDAMTPLGQCREAGGLDDPIPATEVTRRHAGATARRAATDIARAYGHVAPFYDLLFGKVLEPGRRALGNAVAAQKPRTLLEIGVGSGLVLPWYPRESAVFGVDLSDGILARARRRAKRLPDTQVELFRADASRLPFADAFFDCVTVPYTLSVLPEPARVVDELRRVCKPAGTILIVNHFTGGRLWPLVEAAARPLARRLGVAPDFRLDEQVLSKDWQVVAVQPVNAFGLSLLVEIRNTSRLAM